MTATDAKESQMTVMKTATAVWQKNHSKCLQVIEKLWQMGIIEAENAAEWAFKSLKSQADNQGVKFSPDLIEFKILKLLAERTVQKTALLQTLFSQRHSIVNSLVQQRNEMQIDEGNGAFSGAIELSLNKRLFNKLNPEGSSYSSVPELPDFEKEYRLLIEEQRKLLNLMVDSVKNSPFAHLPELIEPFSQAMTYSLRGALMLARDQGQSDLVSIPPDASTETFTGRALNALKAIY